MSAIVPAVQPPQARRTLYADTLFRSRTEARWALFFGHLGIPWQYEVQPYMLAGRGYLPYVHAPATS